MVGVVAFSSLARTLGQCSTIQSPLALFFSFFVVEVEINSRALMPLFSQDQSTVAQRAEATAAKYSLTSCV